MAFILASAYLAVAVLAIRAAAARVREMRPRRGEHLRATELGILWTTSVLAGLAWLPLALAYAGAWSHHRGPAVARRARRTLRVVRRRTSPRRRLRALARRLRRPPAPRLHATRSAPDATTADAWLYEICSRRG